MRIIWKFFKWIFYVLIGLIVVANIVILVSGRLYIYKAVAYTYFRGYMQPSIYDLDVFENRKVEKNGPRPWLDHPKLGQLKISGDDRKLIESYDPASFLVLWGDTVVYEEYWNGHDREMFSNSFSMAKSLVAMMIGIALDEGKIQSLDEPVANYLPEFGGEKEKITIRHVLTMSTGLSWSESYVHPFCDVAELYFDTDDRDLSLNRREIEEEPGKTFIYKSGDTQVLVYILESAVGMKISEYASEKIWKKVGAESDAWWSLADGSESTEKGFCCLYATSRDYLRLGKLINTRGNWNGEQLVSKEFMDEFCSLAPLKLPNGNPNNLYGFQNWIYTGEDFEVTYLRGMRGQYVISIPEKNIVICRIGHSRGPRWENTETETNDDLVDHYIELPDYIRIGLDLVEQAQEQR